MQSARCLIMQSSHKDRGSRCTKHFAKRAEFKLPSFLNQQVNPPEHWQEFEKLCADLWARIWNDPNTQMHGRSGQVQHGVDVYGCKDGKGDWCGVQCKGKDGRYGQAVTERELKQEVKKAILFEPPISEFVLATTAQADANIQKVARDITEEHRHKGLFQVRVYGWNEIHRRLADYSELIDKYYPDLAPRIANVEDNVKNILDNTLASEERFNEKISILERNLSSKTIQGVQSLLISAGLLDRSDEEHRNTTSEGSLNEEIDRYRDLINDKRPLTARALLSRLRNSQWEHYPNSIKFRIITNIACADLALGDVNDAASGFLEAAEYAPEDEKAICNFALALLLLGEQANARTEARKAIAAFPESSRAYSLLVAASADDESIVKIEEEIPSEHLQVGQVAFALSHFYRIRGMKVEYIRWISKAYELESGHFEVRRDYATMLIESYSSDQLATFGCAEDPNMINQLNEGANILREIWEEIASTEVASQNLEIAYNLITAERLLENYDMALSVANAALQAAPDSVDLKRQKIVLCIESGDPQDAIHLIETVPAEHSSQFGLMRAEALEELGDFQSALDQIECFLANGASQQLLEFATGRRLRLIKRSLGNEAAVEAVHVTIAEWPDSVMVHVDASLTLADCGKANDAQELLITADRLASEGSEIVERLIVADAMYQLGLLEQAAARYGELIEGYYDSKPLRRQLICLYEIDRRRDVLDTLTKIPPSTRKKSFYRRIAAAVSIRVGDFDSAKDEIEAYLETVPNDLHMVLNWIGILLRLEKREQIKEFLCSELIFPNAPANDRMHLAHLLDHFGHPEKAIELAYQTLTENPDNADIHLKYIGLVLWGNVSSTLQHPEIVTADTAVHIADADSEDAREDRFRIVEHTPAVFEKGEIPLEHPIAQSLIGKKVGDLIEVKNNPYQTTKKKIVQIKNRYLDALHVSMNEFPTRFPSNQNFMSVSVENPSGNGHSFDAIFQSVSDRHKYASELKDLYKNEPFPIAAIAKMLGVHPIDVWRGFQIDPSIKIICCDGNSVEREDALNIVEKVTTGFVVDPLTLYNIYVLELHEIITETFGNLSLTQSSLDLIRSLVEDRQMESRKGRHSYVEKDGDKFVITQVTKEKIDNDRNSLEHLYKWARSRCNIIPAVGKNEPPEVVRELIGMMHPAFGDSLLAASGSERPLLTEDLRLRSIGRQFLGVEGVWLQVVLLKALEKGTLSTGRYCETIGNLMEAGFFFITINSKVLFELAAIEEWRLTSRLRSMLSELGGKNVDIVSSVSVAVGFLRSLWRHDVSFSVKESLTRATLSVLTNKHMHLADHLIRSLMIATKGFGGKVRGRYESCLRNWCADNSIVFLGAGEPRLAMRLHAKFRTFLFSTTSSISLMIGNGDD